MSKLSDKSSFFIINISNRDVGLADLALTIPSGRCYDLLNGNFSFTMEQLKLSMESGSLYKKRDKIRIGKGKPQQSEQIKLELSTTPIITRNRSAVKVTEPEFKELLLSDDEYALEMAKEFEE